ncbi:uncharacterized protein [Amphiura filiformis]|uniref:uncharacterized protein n=1 Tax=Amphiura filiformis TaxID=82378 RepID=UPI003B21EA54
MAFVTKAFASYLPVLFLITLCLCNPLVDYKYKIRKLSAKEVSPFHGWPPPTDVMTVKNCGPPSSCSVHPWPVVIKKKLTVECNLTAAHSLLDGTFSLNMNIWPFHIEFNLCEYAMQLDAPLCPIKKGETIFGFDTDILNVSDMYLDHTKGNVTITNSKDEVLLCWLFWINNPK